MDPSLKIIYGGAIPTELHLVIESIIEPIFYNLLYIAKQILMCSTGALGGKMFLCFFLHSCFHSGVQFTVGPLESSATFKICFRNIFIEHVIGMLQNPITSCPPSLAILTLLQITSNNFFVSTVKNVATFLSGFIFCEKNSK